MGFSVRTKPYLANDKRAMAAMAGGTWINTSRTPSIPVRRPMRLEWPAVSDFGHGCELYITGFAGMKSWMIHPKNEVIRV